ncbi:glycosyltransferase family 2 protein [Buttiauxella sp. 3AFRM03]|nr:glycosyltransferase family 2 protein [Buttiauxella sp. 3AFRM03]
MKPNRCLINTSKDSSDIILTIAIPTFKRFDLLKETMRSVFANAFFLNVEVIVIDNNPDEDELAINEMDEFLNESFKYYKNSENYGMFGNWNQCLALATGKYITILHDDDLLRTCFSQKVEEAIHLGCSAFGYSWETLDERLVDKKQNVNPIYECLKKRFQFMKREKAKSFLELRDFFFANQFIGTLGVVFERDKALLINGFDENLYPIADYDFWIRWVVNYGGINFFPEKISIYRVRVNESMRPEVIHSFIEKNHMLRDDIQKKGLINVSESCLKSLKERDELLFNFIWSSPEFYKKTYKNILLFLILRCKCYFFLKKCEIQNNK